LVVGLAWLGARQRWRHLRDGSLGRHRQEARASLALAGVLLVVFLAVALLRGQFKGNWILPALVLLWPTRLDLRPHPVWGRNVLAMGVVLAYLTSLGQTVVLARPELLARLEDRLAARGMVPEWATYSTQAGIREPAVSASRTWSDHLHEYADGSAFAGEIRADWCDVQGAATPVTCIVADDYGLACQLHWYLGDAGALVVIYDDGIFHRTWSDLRRAAPIQQLLALTLPATARTRGGSFRVVKPMPAVTQPVTGRPLQPAVVEWIGTPRQESPYNENPH